MMLRRRVVSALDFNGRGTDNAFRPTFVELHFFALKFLRFFGFRHFFCEINRRRLAAERDFLSSQTQHDAVRFRAFRERFFSAETDIEKRLVNVERVLVCRQHDFAAPVLLRAAFNVSENAPAPPEMKIGAEHITLLRVAVRVLLACAPIIVVVKFVTRAKFAADTQIPIFIVPSERNVFHAVEKIVALRFVFEKTPILVCAQITKRRTLRCFAFLFGGLLRRNSDEPG